MMTHDPFQNYQAFGLPHQAQQSIPGIGQPFQTPLQAINPLLALSQNPILQNPTLQGPWQQNPLLQNPLLQNALLQQSLLQQSLLQNSLGQNPWQNPYFTGGLQNQGINPALGYHGWPQQQQQYPYPLAPQSYIGQGGIGPQFGQQFGQPFGQPFGQLHPLAQAALRQASAYGYSPVAGCF